MNGKRPDRIRFSEDPALRRQLKDAAARSLAGWEFGPELRARVLARVQAQELLPPRSRRAPGSRWISWAGAVAAAAVVAGLAILTQGGNLRAYLDRVGQAPAKDAREDATRAAAQETAPDPSAQKGAPSVAAQDAAPQAVAPPKAAEPAPARPAEPAPRAEAETPGPSGLAAADAVSPQPEASDPPRAGTPVVPKASGGTPSSSAAGAPAPDGGGVPEEAQGRPEVTILLAPDAEPAHPPAPADGQKPGKGGGAPATQPGPAPQVQADNGRPAGAGSQENGASDLMMKNGVPAATGLALEYVQGSGAGLEPVRLRAIVTPEVDLAGGLEARAAVVTGEGPVPLSPPRAVRSKPLPRGEAWVVEFAWDQRLGDGSLAPTGVYTVRVEVWAEGLSEPLAARELPIRIVR